jgi:MFS family permease
VAAWLLRRHLGEGEELLPYLVLLGAAAGLWLLATALFAAIREEDGFTAGGRSAVEEGREGIRFLREHAAFRRFVGARSCLLAAQLATPFYVLQAQGATGFATGNLALFLMASSLAAVLASPFWGRYADRSARKVMTTGGGWTVATVILALSGSLLPGEGFGVLLFSLVFLSSGFAEAGVRLGRKTYLVDGAPEEHRPLMVAVANGAVGLVYGAAAGLGWMAEAAGVDWVLGLLLVMGAWGSWLSWRLPEAEELVGELRREGHGG